jgi:eukaryotic-like serine/threonine-protein kinase
MWPASGVGGVVASTWAPVVGTRATLLRSRRVVRVEQLIGEGSQGAVYVAQDTAGGERLALKVYFPHTATPEQRTALTGLVERGAPDGRFLWPIDVLAPEDGLGYAMPLRQERYASLADLLFGKVDVPYSVICTTALELADSFLALHNEGLCYRDISFGNVFFEPATGHVLICDNDNVGIDGQSPSVVLGTRRFMAPEIVRREAVPSIRTDLYSLSVLLFYLLMVGHPLVGQRELDFPVWDDAAESVLFGREPLFVFDPVDPRNAPVEDLQTDLLANWRQCPQPVRDLFVRAFTEGLRDPHHGRVRESVWRAAFARLRDSVLRCGLCGREGFWVEGEHRACWSCAAPLPDPLRLEVAGHTLVLNEDTVVHGHHLHHDYDYATVVARVANDPRRPDRWGLRNEGAADWSVTVPGGSVLRVPAGRSVALVPGAALQVGAVHARLVL